MASIDDGEKLRFENVGLYDGLFVMQSSESKTLWNHISGEAMYGPHVGRTLGPVGNLRQVTVEEALELDPGMEVAISDRPYTSGGRSSVPGQGNLGDDARLMDMFIETLGEEDTRRPRMDMGLGIWTEGTRRYYPMEEIRARDGAFVDRLEGRNVLIFIEPRSATPTAIFVDAGGATVDGDEIRLDSGDVVRSGVLFDVDGNRQVTGEMPQQIFTRWYGYSLTFPGAEVFGQ